MSALLSTDRTLLTAQLDDALEQEVCALCYLGRARERRYLDLLLYQSINDLGVRQILKRSRGLCTYHTYLLLDIGGYGIHAKIAILYKDLVGDMAEVVRDLPSRGTVSIDMETDCPACAVLRECDERFAAVLVDYLKDADRRTKYEHSRGLCLKHFFAVYSKATRALRDWLRNDQLSRLEALHLDLSEFVRKSVVKDEPFGQERDVWIRVLRSYAGTLKLDERPNGHVSCDDEVPPLEQDPAT